MYSHHNRQFWQERQYVQPLYHGHPLIQGHPMQHRHQRFHDAYEGRHNFFRDSWQDNYYQHPHHHHHRHHHRDRDMVPRLIEKFLGGILSGELLRDLDIKIDKAKESSTQDNWKEKPFQRASAELQSFSPDDQLSMNLDFTPTEEQSGPQEKAERFGRTG
ncbi:MAG: hypothetical protein IT343_22140 [Candidatus Melainabacteria bacterium]|jgi:hypothetical protein|nr:hypothetical protein [Candidatus Melainabacteria bacterium]